MAVPCLLSLSLSLSLALFRCLSVSLCLSLSLILSLSLSLSLSLTLSLSLSLSLPLFHLFAICVCVCACVRPFSLWLLASHPRHMSLCSPSEGDTGDSTLDLDCPLPHDASDWFPVARLDFQRQWENLLFSWLPCLTLMKKFERLIPWWLETQWDIDRAPSTPELCYNGRHLLCALGHSVPECLFRGYAKKHGCLSIKALTS